jgi:hypothetical protein
MQSGAAVFILSLALECADSRAVWRSREKDGPARAGRHPRGRRSRRCAKRWPGLSRVLWLALRRVSRKKVLKTALFVPIYRKTPPTKLKVHTKRHSRENMVLRVARDGRNAVMQMCRDHAHLAVKVG